MLCTILGIWFTGLRFLGDSSKRPGTSLGNSHSVAAKHVEVEDLKSSEKGRAWRLCHLFDALESRLEST